MKRCPITYEIISDQQNYSSHGLKLLSPQLKNLETLNFSAEEQRQEGISRTGKMSIQGVQIKLSAQLKVKEQKFELVDQNGHFILKPQSDVYLELPENEAITMSMAKTIDIEVPVHGLIYAKDNSMTYFIKRFDRIKQKSKLPVEDFGQLLGLSREIKYRSSMEKICNIVNEFCSFPKIELIKLFKLTLFNFLVGNEDMHVKNFSLITRNRITGLAPAYDLINSTIVIKNPEEELALPLHGKKKNLSRKDFLQYFAMEKMQLNKNVIEDVMMQISKAIPIWKDLIHSSFLSKSMQEKYLKLLEERRVRLEV